MIDLALTILASLFVSGFLGLMILAAIALIGVFFGSESVVDTQHISEDEARHYEAQAAAVKYEQNN